MSTSFFVRRNIFMVTSLILPSKQINFSLNTKKLPHDTGTPHVLERKIGGFVMLMIFRFIQTDALKKKNIRKVTIFSPE